MTPDKNTPAIVPEGMTGKIYIGETFRDTYYDRKDPKRTGRTIKVVETTDGGVIAETLTDVFGVKMDKPRRTRISVKTLRAGYEPCA